MNFKLPICNTPESTRNSIDTSSSGNPKISKACFTSLYESTSFTPSTLIQPLLFKYSTLSILFSREVSCSSSNIARGAPYNN